MDHLHALTGIVGENGVRTGGDMAPHLVDWRGRATGGALAVVMPATTDQVSRVMHHCGAWGLRITPQGGNTSLCEGSVPRPGADGVVLSLARMDALREMDAVANVAVVEAGMILSDLHERAAEAGRVFPLRLGSEGSARIGGLIATNAGGTAALRYGTMRDLVLGVEAVLPDGSVVSRLGGLRKDNRGYDWKCLFVGGEGTLGVVTAAALRLHPMLRDEADAVCAVASPAQAVRLYAEARDAFGASIEAFELLSGSEVDLTLRHVPGLRAPFPGGAGWQVFVALGDPSAGADLRARLTAFLERALKEGQIEDAMLPRSLSDSHDIWRLRHSVAEGNRKAGHGIVFDVSVRVSRIPDFIERAERATREIAPSATPVVVSHLGDGNVHWIVMITHEAQASVSDLGQVSEALFGAIHDVVDGLAGSFSAEHGIGRRLSGELEARLPRAEIDLLRAIKRAVDPKGTMSPGVMLREDGARG